MSKNGYWLSWFLQEETGRGKAKMLGLANLNKLWGLEAIPNCLIPGLGVTLADSDLECESPIKKVLGVWALNWLVCI